MKKTLMPLALTALMGTAFADDAPASGGSVYQTIIMMLVFAFFFYFVLLRPEQKRRKKMKELRTQLSAGDEVIAMGIVGVVDKVEETAVILKMVDGSKIKVLKDAITSTMPAPTAKK